MRIYPPRTGVERRVEPRRRTIPVAELVNINYSPYCSVEGDLDVGVRMANKPGRPTKLKRAMISEVADLLRKGNYIETVCAIVGITVETFYRWVKEGARTERTTNLKYLFSKAVKRSLAEAETSIVEKIRDAIDKGDVKIGIDFLRRRHPTRWGVRQLVANVDLPIDSKTGKVDISSLDTEDLEEIRKLMTRGAPAETEASSNGYDRKENGTLDDEEGNGNGNGETDGE